MALEFVSYSGHYPNLCSGTLVVKIDGIEHIFKGYDNNSEYVHPKFWSSGGCSYIDEHHDEIVSQSPWELSEGIKFNSEIEKLLPDLLDLFNENVNHGCCGGCI